MQPRLTLLRALCLTLVASSRLVAASGPPDAARVEFYRGLLPEKPHGVGAPISDRAAWEALAKQNPSVGEVKNQAEAAFNTPMPELTDDLYLDYFRTGKRDACQAVMFEQRGRFRALVLAECIENQGRYLPTIEAAIRIFCGQKSWQYPAHDVGQKVFKGQMQDIDLATSFMAWQLATADYWLGEKLAPEVRKLLADELERRVFGPFTGMVTRGKPYVRSFNARGNHCAVDLAGAVGAALESVESRERRAFFAASAEKYIEAFLSGFPADGYCSEGVGYWGYGFGHYVMLAETIKQATGGKVDWLEQERIAPIAVFPRRIEILPGVFPAFADCDVGPRPDELLMGYLNRRCGWGLSQYALPTTAVRAKCVEAENGLFEIALYAFPNSLSAADMTAKTSAWDLRDWFPDGGVLICRPKSPNEHALGAAIKGGHNAEQHNHNDLGSFVLALGKSTPIVDPGPVIYDSTTFGSRRYEHKLLSSFGHSTPRVAGELQAAGAKARAKVLKTEFTDLADTVVMDLSSAYPVKTLVKLERTFVFSREGGGKLTVTDDVEFSQPENFGVALITLAKWQQLGPSRLRIGEDADSVHASISTEEGEVRLSAEEIKEDTPDHSVPTRLGWDFAQPVTKAKVTTKITPFILGGGA
jgi:hypothetical protein